MKSLSRFFLLIALLIVGYIAYRYFSASTQSINESSDSSALNRLSETDRLKNPSPRPVHSNDAEPAVNSPPALSISPAIQSGDHEPSLATREGPKNPITSATHVNPLEKLTSELASDLRSHTWVGGGFKPPSAPDFDTSFRQQRLKSGFTYTNLPIMDGVYLIDFGLNENSSQSFFSASLKRELENGVEGLRAEWIQRKNASKTDLNAFKSAYSTAEVYHGFLHLPVEIFYKQGFEWTENCPEVLVIRHFDWNWSGNHQTVEFFNARVYCRHAIDDLIFVGRMGFQFFSAPTP